MNTYSQWPVICWFVFCFIAVFIIAGIVDLILAYKDHQRRFRYDRTRSLPTGAVMMKYRDYWAIRRCCPGGFYSTRKYVFWSDVDAREAPTGASSRDFSSMEVRDVSVNIIFETFWDFMKFYCRETFVTDKWKKKIPLHSCCDEVGREWIESARTQVNRLCELGYPFNNAASYLQLTYVYYI